MGNVRLPKVKHYTVSIVEKAMFLLENKALQRLSSRLVVRVEVRQQLSFVDSIFSELKNSDVL